MKRFGNLYDAMCSFESLYKAAYHAIKGHKQNTEATRYFYNIDLETSKLQHELLSGTYKPDSYSYFQIYEPKQRTISVASFRDRVVHHALIAQLEPIFERSFIFHSYATRKNKGSLMAIKQAQKYLQDNVWFLKMDIRKYFESINHDVLYSLISHKIKDPCILSLIKMLLLNCEDNFNQNKAKGLPIGNLTSQFFANIYLDPLDHYVTEYLRLPYIRYMDDVLLFSNDKTILKTSRAMIDNYVSFNLHLETKEEATLINSNMHGLSFLGLRLYPNLLRIKRVNVRRLISKIKLRQYQYKCGLIDETSLYRSVQSMLSFSKIADSNRLISKICDSIG